MSVKKHLYLFGFTFRWLLLGGAVGVLSGTASAFFLFALSWVTNYRENHSWIYYFLPLGGFIVGALYYYFGRTVEKGNNQLIDEIIQPQTRIPWIMAPLVLVGTLITHLVGGSAGREGTAVQMGGAIADQFNRIIPLKARDRRILLICGVSAGFASVFGTPLAGTIFALEVYIIGRMRYEALIPSLFAAVLGDTICRFWGAPHLHFTISSLTTISLPNFLWAVCAGIAFAFAGWLFNKSVPFFKLFFNKITFPPLRPLIGGIVLLILLYLVSDYRFMGLGLPTISESFTRQQPLHFFLVKILFTTITLSAGFKGGEVTPLFFIGATLGSAISLFIPLPTDLLAAMGFVAVFAAAANTPIACVLMGIELFGGDHAVFIAIACLIAYLFSGHSGIYSSQIIGSPKHLVWGLHKRKTLDDVG